MTGHLQPCVSGDDGDTRWYRLAADQYCGSEPARESVGTTNIGTAWNAVFASRLAPTGSSVFTNTAAVADRG